jgi:hypothetical protein
MQVLLTLPKVPELDRSSRQGSNIIVPFYLRILGYQHGHSKGAVYILRRVCRFALRAGVDIVHGL